MAHHPEGPWAYPLACCFGDAQDGDCEKIPSGSVRETRNGYVVTLKPGDHHRVSRPHRYIVPYGSVIRSGDGDYHACLHPTEDNLNCFFAPEGQI
jgi:hypothetical protein